MRTFFFLHYSTSHQHVPCHILVCFMPRVLCYASSTTSPTLLADGSTSTYNVSSSLLQFASNFRDTCTSKATTIRSSAVKLHSLPTPSHAQICYYYYYCFRDGLRGRWTRGIVAPQLCTYAYSFSS